MVGQKFNNGNIKDESTILINLKTGHWHWWEADQYNDYEPLDQNYKVTMSNGQLDDE